MSHDERTTVHMASKAESRGHQYWPKAAVEKFLAAEVIAARQTKRETVALKADGKFLQLVAHFFPVNVFRRPVRGI